MLNLSIVLSRLTFLVSTLRLGAFSGDSSLPDASNFLLTHSLVALKLILRLSKAL